MVPIQKQKVVVIGHSTTLRLGTVRAIAELGCEITVVVLTWGSRWTKRLNTQKPFDCYSKYITHLHYCLATDKEALIRLLLDKCKEAEQKVILLPTSDFSTVVLDENRARLTEYFLFPHIAGTAKSIHYWMDKERQKELAREIGLNVPAAHVVTIQNRSYTLPEGISYPCFTKALVTLVGGKQCFNRCNNRQELYCALDAIATKRDAQILVEDFKEIETEYAILGFSDGKEVVISGVVHMLSQTASHFGVAMTGKIMPIAGFELIIDQFKEFVRRIGFVGIFDIDFYHSEGQFYFGEMNLRFGGSGYAVTKQGVNLPAMLVRHLRGEEISGMKMQIDTTATYVNERMCEDDWYRGLITSAQYRQILASADISFVRDEKDPKPQKIFARMHRMLPAKRFLRKLLIRR